MKRGLFHESADKDNWPLEYIVRKDLIPRIGPSLLLCKLLQRESQPFSSWWTWPCR